ncbi:hypothetical protein HMPREF0373_02720 [Eubacterium ramulus ATCC 29099]|uniref:Uncharacterized protein n=1 Tax=Eubacterium ramulus ATCC 29099 TaxID=1256908 RepID=U2QVC1_EUBRA|nr:hypothetical protein HMPREF0373_02720 [Eubacterium ramulus ATCC 29099]
MKGSVGIERRRILLVKNMKYIHSLVKKHEVHPFDEMFHP